MDKFKHWIKGQRGKARGNDGSAGSTSTYALADPKPHPVGTPAPNDPPRRTLGVVPVTSPPLPAPPTATISNHVSASATSNPSTSTSCSHLPAIPDGSLCTISTLQGRPQTGVCDDVEENKVKLSPKSDAAAEGPVQSAHCTSGSRAPVAGQNASADSGPESLWDLAYERLRVEHDIMVEDYQKVLSRELSKTSSNTSNGNPPKDSLDDTENLINADPKERQAQLKAILDLGQKRMDEKKIEYVIGGHKFVLQDQIAQAARFVQWGKDLIDEAVRASPEASMAWCGICLVLPLFTRHSDVEKAHRDGFTYVSGRMSYYVALEPKFDLENQDSSAGISKDSILNLYQHILEFQVRSVLRFFRSRLRNFARDILPSEGWSGMVTKIKELEKTLDKDLQMGELMELNKNTKKSADAMQKLLPASEDIRDALQEMVKLQKYDIRINDKAIHDSREVDKHIPECQPGTRVGILKNVTEWATATESETIFWLHGPAGTGKSAVSRTIAKNFAQTGLLGASYFFMGSLGRPRLDLFFSTVAAQLANSIRPLEKHICKSLDDLGDLGKAKIEGKALPEQFQALILNPLKELSEEHSGTWTRIIVIDALDECKDEMENDIREVCSLLSQLRELRQVRLRVFLSTRFAVPITSAFKSIKLRELSLLDRWNDTKDDISAYLKQTFATIKANKDVMENPWPLPADLESVLTLATTPTPSFIYAATVCRFVNRKIGTKNPANLLKTWLEKRNSGPKYDYASQINDIYKPILQVFDTNEEGGDRDALDCDDKRLLLDVLGSIILFVTPLSAEGSASLLGIEVGSLRTLLKDLHPVLDVPETSDFPVRLLHNTFADFMLGKDGTGTENFQVNEAKAHVMLALKCIDRMQKESGGLRKDMCHVNDYGKLREEIDESLIAKHIPPDLRYACLNWVHHLHQCGQHITSEDKDKALLQTIYALLQKIEPFLKAHFLHWIEGLSLLGNLSDGVMSIRQLLHIVQSLSSGSVQFVEYLRDTEKFLSNFGSIIERAPLQTYGAALAFCPTSAEVKHWHWEQRLPFLKSVDGIGQSWKPYSQILEGHDNRIRAVSFSPDGRTLASASQDWTVRLWSAATGAHKQTLKGHCDSVNTLAFSRDGKTLASASDDETIRLWDAETGTCKQKLDGHHEAVNAVSFLPDGKTLASALDDGTVWHWDTETGAQKQTLKPEFIGRAASFSPDGKTLASTQYWNYKVLLWDRETGAHKQTLDGNDGIIIYAVSFSPDGKTLASASSDRIVRLWNTETGAHKHTLEGHGLSVNAVSFSHDCKTLISASDDETIRLWDIETGTCRQILEGHGSSVNAVSFSPDGKTVASASDDGKVMLWDTATGVYGREQKLENNRYSVAAISFDHKTITSTSGDRRGRLYDAETDTYTETSEGSGFVVNALSFSPKGKIVASASDDEKVRLWDAESGTCKQTLEGHSLPIKAVSFSPDGKTLVSTSGSSVWLWDTETGARKQTLEDHLELVSAVLFSPDGKTLASASYDESVRLWDIETGTCVLRLGGSYGPVTAISFSPDGTTLASAAYDSIVRLWDIGTGTCKQALPSRYGRIDVVSFSPDGKTLASASFVGTVWLWDAETGTCKHTLEGHDKLVYALSFSLEGDMLASASHDGTVQLWDTETGDHKQTLEGYNSLGTLYFSENGRFLKTKRGLLSLPPGSVAPKLDQQDSACALFVGEDWIVRDGQKVIWLPPSYRAVCVAYYNNILVLGNKSGGVTFFSFS